jgi:hypothetical protein
LLSKSEFLPRPRQTRLPDHPFPYLHPIRVYQWREIIAGRSMDCRVSIDIVGKMSKDLKNVEFSGKKMAGKIVAGPRLFSGQFVS